MAHVRTLPRLDVDVGERLASVDVDDLVFSVQRDAGLAFDNVVPNKFSLDPLTKNE